MQPTVYTPESIESINIDRILVNGKRIGHVVMADPHRGIVDAYVSGPDGMLRTDKHRKRILTTRHRGKVEVVFHAPKQ